MDPALLAIILALIGGGGVGFYTARPKKDSIIAEASERAVTVVTKVIERLEEELKVARERIACLEGEIRATATEARATRADLEGQIKRLDTEIIRLEDRIKQARHEQ